MTMRMGLFLLLCATAALASAQSAESPPSAPPPVGRDTASGRFVVLDDASLVADRSTGLVWRRCSEGQRFSADDGCIGLARKLWFPEAARLEDAAWRLPTLNELRSLYDARLQAVIDEEAMPDAPPTWFWARGRGGAAAALGVSCGSGGNDSCYQADARAVRLVRRAPMAWPAR